MNLVQARVCIQQAATDPLERKLPCLSSANGYFLVMTRGSFLLVAFAATIIVGGALAWHFSKPFMERHSFIRQCVANGYTQRDCSCTYGAHLEAQPPYAAFLKSWVHDSRAEFAEHTAILFGRKLAYAGIGIDSIEFQNFMSKANSEPSLRWALKAAGKYLARHKIKIPSYVNKVNLILASYRTARVGWEIAQVTYILDKHCGSTTASFASLPGRAWNATKGAASWTWQNVKSTGSLIGIGKNP